MIELTKEDVILLLELYDDLLDSDFELTDEEREFFEWLDR